MTDRAFQLGGFIEGMVDSVEVIVLLMIASAKDLVDTGIQTNTWCLSGQFLPDGTLLHMGGDLDGNTLIRKILPCLSEMESVIGRQHRIGSRKMVFNGLTIA
eukprot:c22613_g1_i2 orf=546-851(-)